MPELLGSFPADPFIAVTNLFKRPAQRRGNAAVFLTLMVLRSGVAAVRDRRPPQTFRPLALRWSGDAQLLTAALPVMRRLTSQRATVSFPLASTLPFQFMLKVNSVSGGGGAFMVHQEAASPDGRVAASANLRICVKHLRRDVRESADA